MMHSITEALWIGLIIVGLLAFRLLFGHPAFNAMIRYLPQRWQRWLLDQRNPAKKPL
jgi:hypothetical protein